MSRHERQIEIPRLGIVDLKGITNKNEKRVLACLPEVLQEFPDFHQERVNIQDVYALSLNLLPPRYTQAFSIVLKEPVSEEEVREAVRQAVRRVQGNPK